jgi:DNA polymerase alpha subunit B
MIPRTCSDLPAPSQLTLPLEHRPRHSASSTFSARPRPNELLETLNAHLDPADGVPRGLLKQRVQMGAKGRREEWECKSTRKEKRIARTLSDWRVCWIIDRYMFEKVSERSNSMSFCSVHTLLSRTELITLSAELDMMIDDAAERFREAYGIEDLTDPSAISQVLHHSMTSASCTDTSLQDPTYVFGRIISTPTDTGKPTDLSLQFESSRAMGNGKRTPLRFSTNGVKVREGTPGVGGFGWFPGCLVGLKGRNGGGGSFEVEEVIMVRSRLAVHLNQQLIRDLRRIAPSARDGTHTTCGPSSPPAGPHVRSCRTGHACCWSVHARCRSQL